MFKTQFRVSTSIFSSFKLFANTMPAVSRSKRSAASSTLASTSTVQSPTRSRKAKETVKVEEVLLESPGKGRKTKEVKVEVKEISMPTKKRKTAAISEVKKEVETVEEVIATQPKKKQRKTKQEIQDIPPLALRTGIENLKKSMYIGAHVSAAGGVQNAVQNCLHIGGNAFALFLKSQRKWANPPLAVEARDQFISKCKEHTYDAAAHVLPHGSYLVNLAQKDEEKAKQAYDNFVDDLKRCDDLGIKLYNFHPGSTGPHPRPEAIGRIAAALNRAHKETKFVITVLENMAGAGNVIGSTWEDLRDIIALVEDKSRVGVCIDTCHTFAAGYDLRSPEKFKESMDGFAKIVGMSYLKALHLNDSKAPLASNRDLHANIGTGFLGLRAFHNVMNFEPFQGLPMVLETPIDRKGDDGKSAEDKQVWADEIKLLESLIGIDVDTKWFTEKEQKLLDAGAEERAKFQKQADKKTQKTLDAMFKPKGKGRKKVKEEEDSESEGGCSH